MSGESLTIVALSAEVTRLRAALSEIAALQTEEPRAIAYNDNASFYLASGRFEAAEMARKGLGTAAPTHGDPPECDCCGRAMTGINLAGMCPECAR